jgi:hypothetical protein
MVEDLIALSERIGESRLKLRQAVRIRFEVAELVQRLCVLVVSEDH